MKDEDDTPDKVDDDLQLKLTAPFSSHPGMKRERVLIGTVLLKESSFWEIE